MGRSPVEGPVRAWYHPPTFDTLVRARKARSVAVCQREAQPTLSRDGTCSAAASGCVAAWFHGVVALVLQEMPQALFGLVPLVDKPVDNVAAGELANRHGRGCSSCAADVFLVSSERAPKPSAAEGTEGATRAAGMLLGGLVIAAGAPRARRPPGITSKELRRTGGTLGALVPHPVRRALFMTCPHRLEGVPPGVRWRCLSRACLLAG